MLHKRSKVAAVFIGLASLGLATQSDARPDNPWQSLFNSKDLTGWTYYFDGREVDASMDDLVKIEDGVIHIYPTGQDGDTLPFGYLRSVKAYSYYHLRLEYKWGTKRFASKPQAKRGSGLLYHVSGPDKIWPRCVECQIQEGDTGDIVNVGTRLNASVDPAKRKTVNDKNGIAVYLAPGQGGVPFTTGTNGITRVIKSETPERDGWNTVEVIVTGGSATHMVNSRVVNHCSDIQQPGVDDKWVPLTAGRIAIQAEGAEVFFRKIEIRPVDGGPFETPATP